MGEEEDEGRRSIGEVSVNKSGGISSEEDTPRVSGKKRKFYCDFSAQESSMSAAEQRTIFRSQPPDLEDAHSSSEDGEFGDGESSSTSIHEFFSGDREEVASPYSPFCGESEEFIFRIPFSPATPLEKMATQLTPPSAADLEKFFAAAENYDHKRFIEKYNYDIVMDTPLEGRYQWVRLKR